MDRVTADGVVSYRFPGLGDADDVIHAVLTRIGGVSRGPYATLNLGHTVGDDLAAVQENHRRALEPLGLTPEQVVSPHQVHGAHAAIVGRQHRGTVCPETDALLTAESGVSLMMRFGDCTPILIFDPRRRVVGIVHAGWRGIVAGVIPSTVRTMSNQLGSHPGDVWAGIGPAIGPCCYEVGLDVGDDIAQSCPPEADVLRCVNGRVYADLPAAAAAQLRAVGVEEIERAQLCTSCHVNEFFSHRAENGRTGRFGIVIGLRE